MALSKLLLMASTPLFDAYAKCGLVGHALRLFQRMPLSCRGLTGGEGARSLGRMRVGATSSDAWGRGVALARVFYYKYFNIFSLLKLPFSYTIFLKNSIRYGKSSKIKNHFTDYRGHRVNNIVHPKEKNLACQKQRKNWTSIVMHNYCQSTNIKAAKSSRESRPR
jgi:pentatricopeptide repeat protein